MLSPILGFGPGKGRLFTPSVSKQYFSERSLTAVPHLADKTHYLSEWLARLRGTSATEASLETGFISQVFEKILDYRTFPVVGDSHASLYLKPPSKVTGIGRTPDGIIGGFTEEHFEIQAILELKTPGTDLDRPQARANSESPVVQALEYGRQILGTRWVLVSDMKVIRLYSVESQAEYEEIDLSRCIDTNKEATEEFLRLYYLLAYPNLIEGDMLSPVSLIYEKSSARQLEVRDGFYEVYYQIRSDLFVAINEACQDQLSHPRDKAEVLEATQRLLDRLLFIYYCEDHPEQLIPNRTLERVVDAAQALPGSSGTTVYRVIKDLFREVDDGSSTESGLNIVGYNGELFKEDAIIDRIDLPDQLARKTYEVASPSGGARQIKGVWGLHVFDFWTELNEHLLGHVFEESLSDLKEMEIGEQVSIAHKLNERKLGGIFYTSNILSDFMAASALRSLLSDLAPIAPESGDLEVSLSQRIEVISALRVLDPSCGSGAFLVSTYREMLADLQRSQEARRALGENSRNGSLDIFEQANIINQASVLRHCLFGIDLLPQAVEIAKLALWLQAAKKGEKVADLSSNIVSGDALAISSIIQKFPPGKSSFDLVIGNPPWGAEITTAALVEATASLGIDNPDAMDSWELFLLLGLNLLRPGGRLAFVLPDSFLYPEKARIRRSLVERGRIEKILNLGPGWFGPAVRMGTVLVQFRCGEPMTPSHSLQGTLLAGELRKRVIKGEVPISQIEAQRSREVVAARVLSSDECDIEVFRGRRDDLIIDQIHATSVTLAGLCTFARGEEVNKAGLLWVCPSCLSPTVPGKKKKGGEYEDKLCPMCKHKMAETFVQKTSLVSATPGKGIYKQFYDGDDITCRYQKLDPRHWIRLDLPGWKSKGNSNYTGPKLLIRQAGVGLLAAIDYTDARCPQSVYIYRLKSEFLDLGWRHEFVLAALLSRTIAYYVFKRWSEVDPDKAHPKMTHTRLGQLPIPRLDFADRQHKGIHDQVVKAVLVLLSSTSPLDSVEDRTIEVLLRGLWGLAPDDGAYINGEFFDLPSGQVVKSLFPAGVPRYRGGPIELSTGMMPSVGDLAPQRGYEPGLGIPGISRHGKKRSELRHYRIHIAFDIPIVSWFPVQRRPQADAPTSEHLVERFSRNC